MVQYNKTAYERMKWFFSSFNLNVKVKISLNSAIRLDSDSRDLFADNESLLRAASSAFAWFFKVLSIRFPFQNHQLKNRISDSVEVLLDVKHFWIYVGQEIDFKHEWIESGILHFPLRTGTFLKCEGMWWFKHLI